VKRRVRKKIKAAEAAVAHGCTPNTFTPKTNIRYFSASTWANELKAARKTTRQCTLSLKRQLELRRDDPAWQLNPVMTREVIEEHKEMRKDPQLHDLFQELIDADKTGFLRDDYINSLKILCAHQAADPNAKYGIRHSQHYIRTLLSAHGRSPSGLQSLHDSKLVGTASNKTLASYRHDYVPEVAFNEKGVVQLLRHREAYNLKNGLDAEDIEVFFDECVVLDGFHSNAKSELLYGIPPSNELVSMSDVYALIKGDRR
jgi:hypothetical protein